MSYTKAQFRAFLKTKDRKMTLEKLLKRKTAGSWLVERPNEKVLRFIVNNDFKLFEVPLKFSMTALRRGLFKAAGNADIEALTAFDNFPFFKDLLDKRAIQGPEYQNRTVLELLTMRRTDELASVGAAGFRSRGEKLERFSEFFTPIMKRVGFSALLRSAVSQGACDFVEAALKCLDEQSLLAPRQHRGGVEIGDAETIARGRTAAGLSTDWFQHSFRSFVLNMAPCPRNVLYMYKLVSTGNSAPPSSCLGYLLATLRGTCDIPMVDAIKPKAREDKRLRGMFICFLKDATAVMASNDSTFSLLKHFTSMVGWKWTTYDLNYAIISCNAIVFNYVLQQVKLQTRGTDGAQSVVVKSNHYFWNAFFKILRKAPVEYVNHVIDSLLPHFPELLETLKERFLPITDVAIRRRTNRYFRGGFSIFKFNDDVLFGNMWSAQARWLSQGNRGTPHLMANIKNLFEGRERLREPSFLRKLQTILSCEYNPFSTESGATVYNAVNRAEEIMARVGPAVDRYLLQNPVCIYVAFKRFAQTLFDTLPAPSLKKNFRTQEVARLLKKCNEKVDCVVCMETVDYDKLYVLHCGHQFCEGCVGKIKQPRRCPCCRVPFKIEFE